MGSWLQGRRVLVVGLARSGVSAAKLLVREGAIVTVNDGKPAEALAQPIEALRPLGVSFVLGGHDEQLFASMELIVVSPGVPLGLPAFAAARAAGVAIVGEAELASRFSTEPLVGITGTNGKSTTTALIGHLLAASGRAVFVGGNLGTPWSERALAGGALDVSVVELSSFQLETIERLQCRVAVLTNLTPDHLDRYPSAEAYYEAKRAIFRAQGPADTAVLNADDPKTLALHDGARSRRLTFGRGAPAEGARDDGTSIVVRLPGAPEERYATLGRTLRGAHNRENAMAAILAARLAGATEAGVREGLQSFPGLPHRLELVRTAFGAEWINDSKATNVDSTLVALRSFERGVVWIAGGLGKGSPYAPLAPLLPGRVKALLTIGQDAETIERELGGLAPTTACGTLEAAIAKARTLVGEGDTVLLSPACASYDQFRSYDHRGADFRRFVQAL